MHVKSRKEDRRAQRTQRALKDALFLLIQEKHYDDITVQNLIDRANVGRSTFYAHYRDKEDLFRSDWEGFLDGIADHIPWARVTERGRCIPLKEILCHMLERRVFCLALARSRKIDLLFKSGTVYLAKKMEDGLAAQLPDQQLRAQSQTSVSLAVLSNFLAGALFSQIKWWLDNGMSPDPARMDEIFHELVMPGFRASFAAVENNPARKDAA
jgi:AcrR family transcriptional regulator